MFYTSGEYNQSILFPLMYFVQTVSFVNTLFWKQDVVTRVYFL